MLKIEFSKTNTLEFDKTKKQMEKSLKEGIGIRDPLIQILRNPIKKKTTKLGIIIYTQKQKEKRRKDINKIKIKFKRGSAQHGILGQEASKGALDFLSATYCRHVACL